MCSVTEFNQYFDHWLYRACNFLQVYRDKAWLNEGSRLAVGDTVKLTGPTSTGQKGTIRYKGQLHTRQGTWFGLELAKVGKYT